MLQKCVNLSPPASAAVAGATPTPPDSNCLVKKLLPLPTDETYSRKVFIGGLPPDIDQGKPVRGANIRYNLYFACINRGDQDVLSEVWLSYNRLATQDSFKIKSTSKR